MGAPNHLEKNRPIIHEYENYRLYLQDFYYFLKNHSCGFSYRVFSKKAGFSAPNVLKQVMEGERSLTSKSIAKFAVGLGLDRKEAQYFRTMVLLNQTHNPLEKSTLLNELLGTRHKQNSFSPLKRPEYTYLTQWYYVAIRELVAHPSFSEHPNWISDHLDPRVGPEEVKVALEELQQIGLLRRGTNGKLEQSQATISTEDEVVSILVQRFHEQMIQMGQQAIKRFASPQRDISSATLLISKPTFLALKKKIQEFRSDLMEIVQNDPGGDQVYQLNFQLFPLTKEEGKK